MATCEHAGADLIPGRGYIWTNPSDPTDSSVKLKPDLAALNLVVDGAGRVLPAPGFVWVDASDLSNDRVEQPIPQMQMHALAAEGHSVEMAVMSMPLSLHPNELSRHTPRSKYVADPCTALAELPSAPACEMASQPVRFVQSLPQVGRAYPLCRFLVRFPRRRYVTR